MENWDSVSWEQLRSTFYTHNQAQNLQRVLRHELSKLRQFDTISSYIEQNNQQIKLYQQNNESDSKQSEEDKIEYFVSRLNRETSNKVAFEEPASLVEAKALATKVDIFYARSSGLETHFAQKF